MMAKDFSPLTEELIRELDRFCVQQISPTLHEDDENSVFRMKIFQGLGELGLTSITAPEKYGGSELGLKDYCRVLSHLAMYSVSYAVTVSVSCMVQNILLRFGNTEQKETYLPALVSGQHIGAFVLTEPEAGSDTSSLKLKATLDATGENYVLNGTKMFITSGSVASTFIVMARTNPDVSLGKKGISAFVIPRETPGLRVGKIEKKMGWRASPTTELIFENCLVPKSALIGLEGEGLKVAHSALDTGRITIASIAVGLSEIALHEAVQYAHQRKQFKQRITDFQGIQFMISELATEIECSELLMFQAAALYDAGTPDSKISSMAKLKATECAMRVTTDALQIMGGVGYTQEFPLERYMRDAKVLQIVEGTNQIQKVIIAREILKTYQ